MYPRESLSEAQIQGYAIAFEDLGVRDLERGMKRVLKTWKYNSMPTPGYIRACVARALEIENSRRGTAVRYKPVERLTVEQAWADWEETQRTTKEARKKLQVDGAITKAKVHTAPLAIATTERMRELQEQKRILLERYCKRKT
jgi:D-mannonate dehydratase